MLPVATAPRVGKKRQPVMRVGLLLVVAAGVLFIATCGLLLSVAPDTPALKLANRFVHAARSKVAAARAGAALPLRSTEVDVYTQRAEESLQRQKAARAHFDSLLGKGRHASAVARLECRDTNENCKHWAEAGECENNPGFMRPNCPKSCDSCMDAEKRQKLCHRTADVKPLLQAGGVDRTFQTLLHELSPNFDVKVLSRPPKGPWIVTIDDFLREHEIRALMEKGGHHFERSLAGDGVSAVRTSKTSWCNVPFCESDPTIKSIKRRVANATGVPLDNSEHVQVLKYETGDFYRQHHDQNAHKHSPWGPRLYTFFLYLSDVPEGGGTRFVQLNMTVEAKRGRALFWPSVYDSDPSATRFTSDARTTHEALTVTKGMKFAANMWLHQFDFQNTLRAGCRNEDLAEWRPSSPDEADHPEGVATLSDRV